MTQDDYDTRTTPTDGYTPAHVDSVVEVHNDAAALAAFFIALPVVSLILYVVVRMVMP